MTGSYGDAVEETDGGLFVAVDVTPGARADVFPDGYDPWRHRIGVRVRAPPEDGRANRAVEALVAAFFGVAPGAVVVVGGATSRQKRLRVAGVTRSAAMARLGVPS